MSDDEKNLQENICKMNVEEIDLNPKLKLFFFACFFLLGIINNLGYKLYFIY